MDVKLLKRQVDSFARLLRRLDTLPSASVGSIAPHTNLRKIIAGGKILAHLLKR